MSGRRFKFDCGDWIAVRGAQGYQLAGKVVDADEESITVERRDRTRAHYAVGEDAIARVRWRGRRWEVV